MSNAVFQAVGKTPLGPHATLSAAVVPTPRDILPALPPPGSHRRCHSASLVAVLSLLSASVSVGLLPHSEKSSLWRTPPLPKRPARPLPSRAYRALGHLHSFVSLSLPLLRRLSSITSHPHSEVNIGTLAFRECRAPHLLHLICLRASCPRSSVWLFSFPDFYVTFQSF